MQMTDVNETFTGSQNVRDIQLLDEIPERS